MIVIMSSDRGLCGGIHSGICRELRHLFEHQKPGVDYKLVIIGDKAKGIMQRYVCAYMCVSSKVFWNYTGFFPHGNFHENSFTLLLFFGRINQTCSCDGHRNLHIFSPNYTQFILFQLCSGNLCDLLPIFEALLVFTLPPCSKERVPSYGMCLLAIASLALRPWEHVMLNAACWEGLKNGGMKVNSEWWRFISSGWDFCNGVGRWGGGGAQKEESFLPIAAVDLLWCCQEKGSPFTHCTTYETYFSWTWWKQAPQGIWQGPW